MAALGLFYLGSSPGAKLFHYSRGCGQGSRCAGCTTRPPYCLHIYIKTNNKENQAAPSSQSTAQKEKSPACTSGTTGSLRKARVRDPLRASRHQEFILTPQRTQNPAPKEETATPAGTQTCRAPVEGAWGRGQGPNSHPHLPCHLPRDAQGHQILPAPF